MNSTETKKFDRYSIFHRILLLFYTLLFNIFVRRRYKRSFTPFKHDYASTIEASEDEWTREELQCRTPEQHLFEGSSPDGSTALFVFVSTSADSLGAAVLLERNGARWRFESPAKRAALPDAKTLVVGPLRIELREPFRRWRIVFKGTMTNESSGASVFVSLAGWFKPTSDARFFFSNATVDAIGLAIRRRPMALREHLDTMKRLLQRDDIAQWGELNVQLSIGDQSSSEHRLRGLRTRQLGSMSGHQKSLFSCYLEDGNRIVWQKETMKALEGTQNSTDDVITHGFLSRACQIVLPARAAREWEEGEAIFRGIHFDCAYMPLTLHSTRDATRDASARVSSERRVRTRLSLAECQLTLTRLPLCANGYRGHGMVLKTRRTRSEKKDLLQTPPHHSPSPSERARLVLPLTHRAAMAPSLTGGKGSNLARLNAVAKGFVVPRGLVVTVASFEEHVQHHGELQAKIALLSSPGLSLDRATLIGDAIRTCFETCELSPTLRREIDEQLLKSDDDVGGSAPRLVVRSSAVGEDGVELSSAGQLESFIDVAQDDQRQNFPARTRNQFKVAKMILRCWASNYRREVISYRRQHGQILNPPVAVIVQQLVDNAVSGVLFTCDPVRGDPSLLVVNAHAGRGEDVVSGQVTPDHIIIRKTDDVIISKPTNCCLTDDALLQLARVGRHLEEVFERPQDIEFVITQEENDAASATVHIVQSRAVTGLERESPFELRTEFDTGMLTDREVISTCNLGEVFPEPQWPLGRSIILPHFDKAISIMNASGPRERCPRHYALAVASCNGRMMMNMGEMMLRKYRMIEGDRVTDYAIAGRRVFTPEMFAMARERYDKMRLFAPLFHLWYLLNIMWFGSDEYLHDANKCESAIRNLLPTGDDSAKLVISKLRAQRRKLVQLLYDHARESVFSSFAYVVVACITRGDPDGDFTKEMMSDIALIFSNGSGAISGDVPRALKELAQTLLADGVSSSQLNNAGEQALQLIRGQRNAGPLLARFLASHGHRGPGELDCRGATTWNEKPSLLVQAITQILASEEAAAAPIIGQNGLIVRRSAKAGSVVAKREEAKSAKEAESQEQDDLDDVMERLHFKPRGLRRVVMRYMIGQTRRGVAAREAAKNLLSLGTAHVRESVRAIGRLLAEQGFLPDAELVSFFTLDELQQLLETRAPSLVARAHRRRKHFPSLECLRYEYVYFGVVKEIANTGAAGSEQLRLASYRLLTGTTVCEGRVVGRARVAVTLDDARDTQEGEILITRCTDICWSPFFPLLRGVVTEIGGLLSHGAVVAREYGLPSLIAVEHATDVFRTGDLVELNATAGVIAKVLEEKLK